MVFVILNNVKNLSFLLLCVLYVPPANIRTFWILPPPPYVNFS